MAAVYNELEPFCVSWLENLIAAGHIAPGRVDARSIRDLRATDLAGPGQRHFFAGIAGWSLALRLAGVSDDADVWTGSCPCQSLSVAGLQRGADDPRHLWPAWFELIAECKPPVIFGEQVAGAAGLAWLAAVRADLEGLGYAVGAADLAAAGVGAPHIRQRIFWGACRLPDADGQRREGFELRLLGRGPHEDRAEARRGCEVDGLADGDRSGWPGWPGWPVDGRDGDGSTSAAQRGGGDGLRRMGHANGEPSWRDGRAGDRAEASSGGGRGVDGRGGDEPCAPGADSPWGDIEWLECRDGKSRPTRAGLRVLAHGVPDRVGRLRAYGNAIVPEVAAQFIGAFLEAVADQRSAA